MCVSQHTDTVVLCSALPALAAPACHMLRSTCHDCEMLLSYLQEQRDARQAPYSSSLLLVASNTLDVAGKAGTWKGWEASCRSA